MKKFLLVLIIILSVNELCNAQSADKLFEIAENIKLKKGEQSKDYLDALSIAIQQASDEGDYQRAYDNREKHANLVAKKHGTNSLEYADDMFRLGNIALKLNNLAVSLDKFTTSSIIFDQKLKISKRNNEYVEHYILVLISLVELNLYDNSITNASACSLKLDDITKKYYGAYSCPHLYNLHMIADTYYQWGHVDMAEFYFKEIIDNDIIIDSCNYSIVNNAYSNLEYIYRNSNNFDLCLKTAIEHYNKLQSTDISMSHDKIVAIEFIMACGLQYEDYMDLVFDYGRIAENLITQSHLSKMELFHDVDYKYVISIMSLNRSIVGDYANALHYYKIYCDVLKNNGLNNKEYYDALFWLLDSADKMGDIKLIESVSSEIEPLIFTYSDNPYKDAYHYLSILCNARFKLGMYDDAIKCCDDMISITDYMEDLSIISKAQALYAKANIYFEKEDYTATRICIDKGKSLLLKTNDQLEYMSIYVDFLSIEGLLLSDIEKASAIYDTAIVVCNKAIELIMIRYLNINPDISIENKELSADVIFANQTIQMFCGKQATTLYNKGLMLYKHGDMRNALMTWQESDSLMVNLKNINSPEYVALKNNIASCQMSLGDLSNAIHTFDDLSKRVTELYGTDNRYYAHIMLNYSKYYSMIQDFDDAIDYAIISLNLFKDLGSTKDYAIALNNLGALYYITKDYPSAERCLIESCEILENHFYNTHIGIVYQNLATMYFEMNQEEQGWKYYEKAKHSILDAYGEQSLEYASLMYSIGYEMKNRGDSKAYDYYLSAYRAMDSLGYYYHPLYVQSLIQYGYSGLDYNKPLDLNYPILSLNSLKEYYQTNAICFASIDRMVLIEYATSLKDIIFNLYKFNKDETILYDYVLFSKSLMLFTEKALKQSVYQTCNEDIINDYEDLMFLKKIIDNQNFDDINSINTKDVYKHMSSSERALLSKMKEIDAYSFYNDYHYDDIKKALRKNELAIEFVDYCDVNHEIQYVALLVKSSWEQPVFVNLCQENDLVNCIDNPNIMYSTESLYQTLWQPLSDYVKEGDVVYFSPSGKIHTIALESIHTPDGRCLSDKYNLIRLTSTRELCLTTQSHPYKTSVIYGGLNYDVELQRMEEAAQLYESPSNDNVLFSLRGQDRGSWNYLQGTQNEVDYISNILRKANINCTVYDADNGNEESFKSLSNSDVDIIHLATHGFFIENEMTDKNQFMNSLSKTGYHNNDTIIDPMLRSGLILSGGNNTWLGKNTPMGIEDGILTALEISTMNLYGTDLVVLSACETGLGDITNDGVFGLQRAFKMAGVKTLVMSLWKVDDMATSLMMQTFYEQLVSGKSKREAFNIAQSTVRNKYPEPYYWAAFIMLD